MLRVGWGQVALEWKPWWHKLRERHPEITAPEPARAEGADGAAQPPEVGCPPAGRPFAHPPFPQLRMRFVWRVTTGTHRGACNSSQSQPPTGQVDWSEVDWSAEPRAGGMGGGGVGGWERLTPREELLGLEIDATSTLQARPRARPHPRLFSSVLVPCSASFSCVRVV